MHATKRTGTFALGGALAMVVAGLTPASADPPTAVVIRTVVEETRPSPNLTRECGVPVTNQLSGTRTWTLYPDRQSGLVERFHNNVAVVATSEFGEVRFRHNSMFKVVIQKDGTWLFHEAGQGPIGQKGHYLSDITGAEEIVLKQAATSIDEGIAGFCAVLNP
jgi:hypothetical protein